jgi:imidazolonepropionase-like amidohydrolase
MRSFLSSLVIAFLSFGCATPTPPANTIQAIEHVTVHSMLAGAAPQQDQTVLIANGRIAAVGPAARIRIPAGAQIIDGRDRYLIPGLADLHVHAETPTLVGAFMQRSPLPPETFPTEDVYLPYLANGVVQVLHMSADADTLAQRRAIAAGDVLGPRLTLARMVDGQPRMWPFAQEAATPEAAAALVRQAHADGYDFIKVYSNASPAIFSALVEAARPLNMRVIGHIPGRREGQPERFLCHGLAMVGHAEEFAYQGADVAASTAQIDSFVALARRCGTTLTTTLTLNERIVEQASDAQSLSRRPELPFLRPITQIIWLQGSPYINRPPEFRQFAQSVVDFNRQLVLAFARAGVPILPGTDAGIPGMAGGYALHDELEALQRIGVDRRLILESATRGAAEFLGNAGEFGTVEVGRRADLLLLDADPLQDVANTRRISGLFLGGRYLSAADLAQRMAALAERNRQPPTGL